MKVIVAGYPKTGTKSLTQALTSLGYKTYDFMEHWWFHGEQWLKIFNGNPGPEIFLDMYKDVDAVVDAPTFFFWEEIHKLFPDAKIILTVREEDSWYRSLLRQKQTGDVSPAKWLTYFTVACRLNPIQIWKFLTYLKSLMRVEMGSTMDPIGSEMVDRMHFRRHYAHVLQAAPKDKLLVYNITEGWGPLCEFLGHKQPDAPFPHKNKLASFADDLLNEHPIAIKNIRDTKRRFKFLALILFGAAVAYFLC